MSRVHTSFSDDLLTPPEQGAITPASAAIPPHGPRSWRPGPPATVLCAVGLVVVMSADFLGPLVTTDLSAQAQVLFTDCDVMAAAGSQARLGHFERAYDNDWMVRAAPSMGVTTGHWSPFIHFPTAVSPRLSL